MKPLSKQLIYQYKQQDNAIFSAMLGYNWKLNWLGAWRLMRDYNKGLE